VRPGAVAFEQPVATGGQQVLPADHVLADCDGMTPIGRADVEAVVAAATAGPRSKPGPAVPTIVMRASRS
jgi:regulator of RNase E activity RraA